MARALAALEDQPDYSEFCELIEAGCDIEPFSVQYTGTELQNLTDIYEKRNLRKEDYVIILTAAIRGLFCPNNETGRTDFQLIKTAGRSGYFLRQENFRIYQEPGRCPV